MGAEYPVTLCDLGVFADQAAEPVPTQDPDIRVHKGRTVTPSGRALAERPVRAMNVIVLDILTQDQPQVPPTSDQHPVQALVPGAGNPPVLLQNIAAGLTCEFTDPLTQLGGTR